MSQPAPDSGPPRPVRPCGHFVSGIWVACCEDGETDCPCICHANPNAQETM